MILSDSTSQSIGVLIDTDKVKLLDAIATYACDTFCLFMSTILIQSSRLMLTMELEDMEKYRKFFDTSMKSREYYRVAVSLAVVTSLISSVCVPSTICGVLLVINLTMLYLWSFKSISLSQTWVITLYNVGFYTIFATFIITYIIQIPTISNNVPEGIMMTVGFGCSIDRLEPFFLLRNFIFLVYLCFYFISLRTKSMESLFNAQGYEPQKEQKDITKMNQFEFAAFMYKRKAQEKGWGNWMKFFFFLLQFPFLHTFLFRLLIFIWIFMFVSFESLALTVYLLYSIIESKESRYVFSLNYIYFPIVSV